MLVRSLLLCVLIGSVLQTSFCQDTKTGDGVKGVVGVKGGGTQTNDTGTQTDDLGTKTDDTETQTDNTGTPTDDTETQTGDLGTQTDDTGTPTDDTETQTGDLGTQTDDTGSQTDDLGTQTDDTGTETDDTESQTDDTETQTGDLGTPADDTESQTDDTGTQTDNTGTQTDDSGTQTDDEGEGPVGNDEPVFLPEGSLNPYRESITWDAQTAHPRLTLTADWKTVTLTNNSQNLDNNTKRFDKDPCVLGSAGYQSGKHYWLIGGKGGWLVGVAAQSVKRKGYLYLDPSAGIYVIPRSVDDKPEKIGTFLECDKRQVSFVDAATREVLLSIGINCTEPIYPFAFIGVGALTVE